LHIYKLTCVIVTVECSLMTLHNCSFIRNLSTIFTFKASDCRDADQRHKNCK